MKKTTFLLSFIALTICNSLAQTPIFDSTKVYDTVIPRSIRLSEAPSHGLPGVVYDRVNKGSKAYMALAAEFLARNEK